MPSLNFASCTSAWSYSMINSRWIVRESTGMVSFSANNTGYHSTPWGYVSPGTSSASITR